MANGIVFLLDVDRVLIGYRVFGNEDKSGRVFIQPIHNSKRKLAVVNVRANHAGEVVMIVASRGRGWKKGGLVDNKIVIVLIHNINRRVDFLYLGAFEGVAVDFERVANF